MVINSSTRQLSMGVVCLLNPSQCNEQLYSTLVMDE